MKTKILLPSAKNILRLSANAFQINACKTKMFLRIIILKNWIELLLSYDIYYTKYTTQLLYTCIVLYKACDKTVKKIKYF